jgi:2-polyprenyl-3-methyl-5-hydroxy-6-metoxy-1,4-benzoquinol methylase
MIQRAKKEYGTKTVKWITQDAETFLKKTKYKYDIIITASSLHHMDNPYEIIKLMIKKLNKEGTLYITVEPILERQNKIDYYLKIIEEILLHGLKNHEQHTTTALEAEPYGTGLKTEEIWKAIKTEEIWKVIEVKYSTLITEKQQAPSYQTRTFNTIANRLQINNCQSIIAKKVKKEYEKKCA